jgi:hypothetical protein
MNNADLERAKRAADAAAAERDRIDHGPGSEGQWKHDNAAHNAQGRAEQELGLQLDCDEQAADEAEHAAFLAEFELEKRRASRSR